MERRAEQSGAALAAHLAEGLRVVCGLEAAQLSVLSVKRICPKALPSDAVRDDVVHGSRVSVDVHRL